ncbi:MAG: DUF389 domain-containing protein [Gemmatimonadota bacterium]|jgi:uncharacterized membrane protein|nr:DUF389 domain-containing protein [Gemmatimonadota bacterium]
MRQLHVQVRAGRTQRVLALANEHKAFSPTAVRAEREDGEEWSMIFLNLPNDRVGSLVWAIRDEVEDAQFVIIPRGSLPIQPPFTEVDPTLRDVSRRSTLELVLDSLQSIGSWKGMLLYAAFSGVVAAYGVIFNISYLLVAAMLIAPMGAPIMVSVVGVALGDWKMFGRGALRFVSAIVVLVASAVALGFAYGLSFSTSIMEQITSLSSWGVAVALVAGAAGAQSQVQSDRTSLVTGTATGFLIAAALSPASAVLGLALTIGRWDYAALMGFQLGLQFVAITFGGWLSLLVHGVHPDDPSTGRGSARWRALLAAGVGVALVLLVAWQTRQTPRFLKADLSREAVDLARGATDGIPGVRLIGADARFTRPDLQPGSAETLLVEMTVENTAGASDEQVTTAVRSALERRIRAEMPRVVPFVAVTVLPGRESP